MKIIGMDLGTSNTYLFHTEMSAQGTQTAAPEPLAIRGLSDDNGSMATVVLYENDKALLAGNAAEGEFYTNVPARAKRRLESQFKPEIATGDPTALRAMTDFLLLLRKALPDGFLAEDTAIYVGIPSLAKEDFSLNLGKCFNLAGWPRPFFVRESDAALVSCLQSGVLDIDDMEHKCAILDFGGGTCDYTTVENMTVLQNGGDMLYGGRLFDDLFFQVFQRNDPKFAACGDNSPYTWFAHWVECRLQKEKFSDYLRGREAAKNSEAGGCTLHLPWYEANGERHDIFVKNYSQEDFIGDAENFAPSAGLLTMLSGYANRGGMSAEARDLFAGREIGLLSWLRDILEKIDRRQEVAKIVLTGGSSRWPFVDDLVRRLFPQATCISSRRSYEDIAYGLALFPILSASRDRAAALLNEKIEDFAARACKTARQIMNRQSATIVKLCSERIVNRDVMPVLEAAQKNGMTVAELEQAFETNIRNDEGLLQIAREKSKALRDEIQDELNFSFRHWLMQNGVLLAPNFVFPAQAIGQEFFKNISVRISRLDSLQLMKFTLTTILPVVAATTTATTIAHSGEPVSTIVGGGMAFGATWVLARTAPKLLENRKLPAFLLSAANRKKIVEKNRTYIEKALNRELEASQGYMETEIERRLHHSITSMLGRLTILNQVKTQ